MTLQRAKGQLLRKLARDVSDSRVLDAMWRVPRESFLPAAVAHLAYEDVALPIAGNQTISQPTIVAMMVDALSIRRLDKVLEIGTGSGYQAAILGELARCVLTLERIPELADAARLLLRDLGYGNVRVDLAGPTLGLPEDAPYNAILVAAGAPRLPNALVDQLADGGRLVVPVGDRTEQTLLKVVKAAHGPVYQSLGACRFVPLIGEDAWPDEDAQSNPAS